MTAPLPVSVRRMPGGALAKRRETVLALRAGHAFGVDQLQHLRAAGRQVPGVAPAHFAFAREAALRQVSAQSTDLFSSRVQRKRNLVVGCAGMLADVAEKAGSAAFGLVC